MDYPAHAAVQAFRRPLAGETLTLVADLSRFRLQQIEECLAGISHVHVLGRAVTFSSALRLADKIVPDLLVSDLYLIGGTGLELARRIHLIRPSCRVVIVSQVAGEVRAVCLANGADGFVLRSRLSQELPAEIRRLLPDRMKAPG